MQPADPAADAPPIETLKETNRVFELAVIAFTKGSLSPEEFWAECDGAATSATAARRPAKPSLPATAS